MRTNIKACKAITKTLFCTAPHQIKRGTALTEISVQCLANSALYQIQVIGYLDKINAFIFLTV